MLEHGSQIPQGYRGRTVASSSTISWRLPYYRGGGRSPSGDRIQTLCAILSSAKRAGQWGRAWSTVHPQPFENLHHTKNVISSWQLAVLCSLFLLISVLQKIRVSPSSNLEATDVLEVMSRMIMSEMVPKVNQMFKGKSVLLKVATPWFGEWMQVSFGFRVSLSAFWTKKSCNFAKYLSPFYHGLCFLSCFSSLFYSPLTVHIFYLPFYHPPS